MNPIKKFNEWRFKHEGRNDLVKLLAILAYLGIGYQIYQQIGQKAAIIFFVVTFVPFYGYHYWRTKAGFEKDRNLLADLWWLVVAFGTMFITFNLFGLDSSVGGGIVWAILYIGVILLCPDPVGVAKRLFARIKKRRELAAERYVFHCRANIHSFLAPG